MDKNELFVKKVNNLLKKVNFQKLNESANGDDKSYAKKILKDMHETFVKVYGTDYLDWRSGELVELPAVIKGEESGKIALGLVTVDLQSSGEHWGSYMLTEIGVVDHGGEDVPPAEERYIAENFVPYNYWYTPYVSGDHHVNFDNVPEDVAEILSVFLSEKITEDDELAF